MSDFAGALFGGAAAQAADASLQKWRALWQQEEAMRLQQEDAEKNRQLTRDMQADAQAFQQLMAQKAQEFQLGLVTRQEAFDLGMQALRMQPDMSMEGQALMAEHLEAIGSEFLPLFQSGRRTSLFANPQAALDYLEQARSAPLGTKFDPFFLKSAAEVAASVMGLEGKEREEMLASYDKVLELRQQEGTTLDDINMQLAGINLGQAQANLAQTHTQTANIQANTALTQTEAARVAQGMTWEAEDRDLYLSEYQARIDNLKATTRSQLLDGDAQEIQNGYLPARLQAEIGDILASTRAKDDAHELHVATFNDVVRTVAAEADITTEEARYLVANSALRDALMKQEYDHGEAIIASVWQSIEASKSSVLNDETYRAQVAQGMLFEVIANGDSGLMASMGAQILSQMGFSDAQVAELTASWGKRMDEGLSRGAQEEQLAIDLLIEQGRQARSQANVMERTEDAQVRDAEATASFNEGAQGRWEAEFGQRQHEFNTDQANVMKRHADAMGLDWARLQEGARQHNENLAQRKIEAQDQRWYWGQQVALESGRLAQMAAGSAAGGGAAAAAPASHTDFLNAVQDSTGIGLEQLQQNAQAASDMAADLQLANDILADPNLSTEDKNSQVATLLGFDPTSGLAAEVMVEQLKAKAENARLLAVSNIVAYQKAYANFYPGQVMTLEQLGLTDTDTSIYVTALENNGVVRQQLEAEEAALLANPEAQATIANVYTALNQYLLDAAPTQGVEGLSLAGANAIYDALLDEFTPEELATAGLRDAAALMDSGARERAGEIVANDRTAQLALERLGASGVNLNTDHAAREAIVDELNTEARGYLTFAQEITRLPDISQASRGWWQGLLGAPQAMPEPSQAHYQAGARLVGLLEATINPQQLVEAGVVAQGPQGYYLLDPAGATAYLNGAAQRRQQEAQAVLERSRRAQ